LRTSEWNHDRRSRTRRVRSPLSHRASANELSMAGSRDTSKPRLIEISEEKYPRAVAQFESLGLEEPAMFALACANQFVTKWPKLDIFVGDRSARL